MLYTSCARGGALEDFTAHGAIFSRTNLKGIFIVLIAVDVVVIAGAAMWLGAPDSGCACPTQWLSISKVYLGHGGTATFILLNSGPIDFTITQATVTGQGISGTITVNLFSNNVISYKSGLNLSVLFSHVDWWEGGRYEFTLTDSQAYHFIASVIA